MSDEQRTKTELLVELAELRRRVSELEVANAERKQTEKSLQKSEAKFCAIVENSNDGIVFMDAGGKILHWSPSYRQINGYADEERLGQDAFETVHPDDVDAVRAVWDEIIQRPDISAKVECRIRYKDGAWKWIESTLKNLLRDPDVQSVIATSRDINERKQAEEQLRESELRFLAIYPVTADLYQKELKAKGETSLVKPASPARLIAVASLIKAALAGSP